MGFFKTLFCKHNFVCYRNGTDANGYLSSFWVCTKCNMKLSKRGQSEVHPSFVINRGTPSHVSRPAVSEPTPDHTADMMNPLNPLSPLNPANIATATVNDECDDLRKYDYLGSVRGVVANEPCHSASYSASESSSSCSSSSYDDDSSSSSCSSSSSDY